MNDCMMVLACNICRIHSILKRYCRGIPEQQINHVTTLWRRRVWLPCCNILVTAGTLKLGRCPREEHVLLSNLSRYIYIYLYDSPGKTSMFRFIWGLRYHSFRVKISYCGKKKLNVISFVYCASGWKYENFCSCNVPFYSMFYIWTLLSQLHNAFSEGREFSRNLSLSIAIISRFFFASLRSKGCPFIT